MKIRLVYLSAILAVSLSLVSFARAQESRSVGSPRIGPMAENSLYVELLGNGILYSLNYDRMLTEDMSARLGFEYLNISASGTNEDSTTSGVSIGFYLVPATINFFLASHDNGKVGSSKLEIGAGPLFIFVTGTGTGTLAGNNVSGSLVGGTATLGYRYQSYDGGFVFRVGFTPIYLQQPIGFRPLGGISLGYAF